MSLTDCTAKADGKMFLKTKMCTFYSRGRCSRGASCKFAHESQELQRMPDLHKTRPCFALLRNGRCKDGSSCQYAHSREELRASSASEEVQWPSADYELDKLGEDDTWSRQTTGDGLDFEDDFGRQVSEMSRWSESVEDTRMPSLDESEVAALLESCKVSGGAFRKTKLCKFFVLGKCTKGGKCNFAHENDLKPQPNLFRTRPCLALLRMGKCRDGDACKYAHTKYDIRSGSATPYTSGTVTPSIDAFTSEAESFDDAWSRLSTAEGAERSLDLSREFIDRSTSSPITEPRDISDSAPTPESSHGSNSNLALGQERGGAYSEEATSGRSLADLTYARLREGCAVYGLNISVKNTFLAFEERDRSKFSGSCVRAHSQ